MLNAPEPIAILNRAREDVGLSHGELWLRYFEIGGMSTALQLEAILCDALAPTVHDHDLIAHALNERYKELARLGPLPYLEDENGDAERSAPPGADPGGGDSPSGSRSDDRRQSEPDRRHDPVIEDRERIAADLHDTVIQRLYATGLPLHGVLLVLPNSSAAEGIEAAVIEIDGTIRQIRSTILGLETSGTRLGMRAQILSVADDASRSLGFKPSVTLSGAPDGAVAGVVIAHLVAVLREALSNVVRHATASRVEITVVLTEARLTATVKDDGVGPGKSERAGGRGISNMDRRARDLGGWMSLAGGAGGQSAVLTWEVPI